MNITAIKNRVFVEPIVQTQTATGLLIPDAHTAAPMIGRVLAAGPGATRKGKFEAVEVQPGQVVIFPRNAGEKLKLDDREIVVMLAEDILGRVEEDAA